MRGGFPTHTGSTVVVVEHPQESRRTRAKGKLGAESLKRKKSNVCCEVFESRVCPFGNSCRLAYETTTAAENELSVFAAAEARGQSTGGMAIAATQRGYGISNASYGPARGEDDQRSARDGTSEAQGSESGRGLWRRLGVPTPAAGGANLGRSVLVSEEQKYSSLLLFCRMSCPDWNAAG